MRLLQLTALIMITSLSLSAQWTDAGSYLRPTNNETALRFGTGASGYFSTLVTDGDFLFKANSALPTSGDTILLLDDDGANSLLKTDLFIDDNHTVSFRGEGTQYLNWQDAGLNVARIGQDLFDRFTVQSITSSLNLNAETSIFFRADGTVRMEIQDDGRVGIGNTNPQELLDVDGNIGLSGSSRAIRFIDASDAGLSASALGSTLTLSHTDGFVDINADKNVDLQTQGISRLLVTEQGDVAIGTGQPTGTSNLDVNGQVTTSDKFVLRSGLDEILEINQITDNVEINAKGLATGLRLRSANRFVDIHTSQGFAARFTETGRLGIGTDNPADELEIVGNMRLTGSTRQINFENNGVVNSFIRSTDTGLQLNATLMPGDFGSISLGAKSRVSVNVAGQSAISIRDDANIGIGGETNPEHRLVIMDELSTTLQLINNSSGTGISDGLLMIHSVGGSSSIINAEDANLGLGAFCNTFFHIADGNIGIGNNTPSFTLDVTGDVNITGELSSASDRRLKRDFQELDGALEVIKALHPVSYEFRTEQFPDMELSTSRQMGLVAQELEEILPDLVAEGSEVNDIDGNGFTAKSVKYQELIPLLIKAVQELLQEIEIKDAKLAKLHLAEAQRTNILEDRLTALEAAIKAPQSQASRIAE